MYWKIVRWGGTAVVAVIVIIGAIQMANDTGSRGPAGATSTHSSAPPAQTSNRPRF
jgi:hypothetical protein